MTARTYRIGTRGSALAMIQARSVAAALQARDVLVRLETIVTDGDRRAADTTWGEGAFVTAIETALLAGEVDIAAHSAKDIPTKTDPRLAIAAFLPREASTDALVLPGGRGLWSLGELPSEARVGTDSPRRTAFLRSTRPDLLVHPIHGNVDTRLRRLDAGETEALVLATAGLRRLGRQDRISLELPFDVMPSAPGQGAIAVQIRADDLVAREVVAHLDDKATRRAVEAERSLLALSGGGCRAPVGAFATVEGPGLRLRAGFATADGRIAVRVDVSAEGRTDECVVAACLDDLALAAAESAVRSGRPRIVVMRARHDAAALILALVDRGAAPVHIPTIEVGAVDSSVIDDLVAHLDGFDVVVLTSVHAVAALAEASRRTGIALGAIPVGWAVIGEATERASRDAGIVSAFRPSRATAIELGGSLPIQPGQSVILPRGDLADDALPRSLRARGAIVDERVVYRTTEAPASSRELIRAALADPPVAILATSGSTVRGWLRSARDIDALAAAMAVPVVAIGPTTAAVARDLGLTVAAVSAAPDPAAVADTVAALIEDRLEM